jgi:uncharacterized protein (TIGR03118 family)
MTQSPVFAVMRSLAIVILPALSYGAYSQTNLVSDLPGVARTLDPNLQNPWGIALSGTSPFWISDNGTGLSTLYNGSGQIVPLVVTVPPPGGGAPPSAPTGMVFNGTSDFNGSHFIFATEDGTISAWTSGSNAALAVDNSATGAVYKGLALANNGSKNLLYAANFNAGTVDVFGPNFAPVSTPGGFHDPTVPAGYAPFNIEAFGGQLFVTYAKQDAAKHDDVAGAGNGYVDIFDTNGNLITRLISNGPLNSPWGMAIAGPNFGQFANDLLVGNFGNGMIDAFNRNTGAFLGVLTDPNGNAIVNPGLWALAFGNGNSGGNLNTLYFTAGIPGPDQVEDHGLFGQLDSVPEPSSVVLLGGALGLLAARKRFQKVRDAGGRQPGVRAMDRT